jgi:Abnormal spindle-like microcephaly-assoc'd, ASPM-SPD-2-Hydin
LFIEVKLVDQIYVSPPSGPEVATPIALARNDRSQLNQPYVRIGTQIRPLNGWRAGLRITVACCLVFSLLDYGFVANAKRGHVPRLQLTVSATSVAFGNVEVNTASTQTVTLSSTGTAAVTVSAATVTGKGFTVSGSTFPVNLNPGQAVTLDVQFDPTATGAVTGQLTIQSNSSTNGTVVISLSGTGTTPQVDLSWDAPSSSPDPVAGYNIYRSTGGSSSYQLLNSSIDTETTYVDSTVQSGTAYTYYVESVDSSGVKSAPSNLMSVTIP